MGNLSLSNCKGGKNTAIGDSAGINVGTGDFNILIANMGQRMDTSTTRIGDDKQTQTFISGISGTTVADGVGVIIDSSGKLGTVTSSARYKKKIQPMNRASETILALQPVTFEYKEELDPRAIPKFGLVAEEVEKVDRDLVARDAKGKPYTVRYEAVNAMLLNEFLKEHRKVGEQQVAIDQLKSKVAQQEDLRSTVARQQQQLADITSQIQEVSDQLGASKGATANAH